MGRLRIAIDVMGGDFGASTTIPAVVNLAKRYPDIQFQLYAESSVCSNYQNTLSSSNILFTEAVDSISMDESPAHALRHKRDSSMAKALQAVAEDKADGCISAGNTGALVALGLHFLKTFSGIDRPALCQAIPTEGANTQCKHSYMLDLGANVDCTAEQLKQFAYLGAALCSIIDGNLSPTIRLLNIGGEAFKGPLLIQQSSEYLQSASNIQYQGFIEGNEIYQGVTDVIVCDGFAGNIALKTSEGVARFVTDSFKRVTQRNLYGKFMAWLSQSALRRWQSSMNPDLYNGAYLLGLRGTVVKSHGGANKQQFAYALEMLIHQLQRQNICSMEESLTALMTSENTNTTL